MYVYIGKNCTMVKEVPITQPENSGSGNELVTMAEYGTNPSAKPGEEIGNKNGEDCSGDRHDC